MVLILCCRADDASYIGAARSAALSWRNGTKGPLQGSFAAARIRIADGPPQRIHAKGQQAHVAPRANCSIPWPDVQPAATWVAELPGFCDDIESSALKSAMSAAATDHLAASDGLAKLTQACPDLRLAFPGLPAGRQGGPH